MMSLKEIGESMKNLNNWSLEVDSIVKNLYFKDFKEALEFVNKVGEIAEKNEHHPDILVLYNQVRLTLTTHSVRGLSERDFKVAGEIDELG